MQLREVNHLYRFLAPEYCNSKWEKVLHRSQVNVILRIGVCLLVLAASQQVDIMTNASAMHWVCIDPRG